MSAGIPARSTACPTAGPYPLTKPAWVLARHSNTGRNQCKEWVGRFCTPPYSRNPILPKIRPCFRSSHSPMLHAVVLSKSPFAMPK